MIQTLGDVFVLVAIISVGVVSFLLAVFLYHLIFVIMDLRQVAKRANDITAEVEDLLMRPVELVASISDWVQKMVWETYFVEEGGDKKKGKRKGKKGGKKSKKKS